MFAYKNNIDPPPIFNTGDEVEFEVARGTNYARWDYHREDNINNDLGPSGLWAQGVVVDSSDYEVSDLDHSKWIYIRYEIEGMIGAGYLAFPRPSNPAYHEWQWKREGFLRKKHNPKCVCGSEKIYGVNTTLHSFWCEKGVKKGK
jgi:hypothetical protein